MFAGGEEHCEAALAQGRAIILGAHIAGTRSWPPFPRSATARRGVRRAGAYRRNSSSSSRDTCADRPAPLPADREGGAGGAPPLQQERHPDRRRGPLPRRQRHPRPFFGRTAYLSHGPIVLAQRHNTPILPTTLRRLKHGRFQVRLHPPLQLVDTGNRHADLGANMRLMAAALEQTIGGVAEQWQIFEPPGPPPPMPRRWPRWRGR